VAATPINGVLNKIVAVAISPKPVEAALTPPQNILPPIISDVVLPCVANVKYNSNALLTELLANAADVSAYKSVPPR
jgi:hypothetical protein